MAHIFLLYFSFVLLSEVLGDQDSYCNRKWPSLELFMPYRLFTNHQDPRYYEFEATFMRSFLLFFPLKLSNVSLILAIDAERDKTPEANELRVTVGGIDSQMPGGARVALLPESHYYRRGYDRQQLVMFWADNFTSKEYVGFTDTDAAFITYVDREDLFEDGKPVVNARSGNHPVGPDGAWRWTSGSFHATGLLEPFKCMAYFPVIVKVSHLPEMRDYIAKHHNLTFNEAFYHNISNGDGYSQFGIMCTYLYAFKRDEYQWYIHSETPDWDGKNPPPIFGQDGNISQFTPQMKQPKPRVATHVGYRRCPVNPIVSLRYCPIV